MSVTVKLIDQFGRAIPDARTRARASLAQGAYTAASSRSQELSAFKPQLLSADAEVLPERGAISARARDLARNNGWASSAVTSYLDNVIGRGLRLSANPDYRALGIDKAASKQLGREIEAEWRAFAMDPSFWSDATRTSTIATMMGTAFRHEFVDGDAFAMVLWQPENVGTGRARYATTFQLIDPDRVSNPNDGLDTATMRGGVEIDQRGAPVAYHVRSAHPSDWLFLYAAGDARKWERVERETAWGRWRVVHSFERMRSNQHRGVSALAPVIEMLKMTEIRDRVELQAGILNAVFAAYIESPFDHSLLQEALSSGGENLTTYQSERAAFHDDRRMLINGVRIPTLFPGERINVASGARAVNGADKFVESALRNIAAGVGSSYEQISRDWSKTNYSSARAALLEVWKSQMPRRERFCERFATAIYLTFLEEAIVSGRVQLPPGAPDFYEAKAAYSRCRWIGPGRGWVDPVKEAQAAGVRMDEGLSTLEAECAEQGLDYEEVLEQRAYELQLMDELGLPRPQWARVSVAGPDTIDPQQVTQ